MFRRVLNRNSDVSDGSPGPHRKHVSKLGIEKPRPPSESIPPPTRPPNRMRSMTRGRRGHQLDQHISNSDSQHQQRERPSHISGGRSVLSAAEDLMSIQSTITVETTRTTYNENRKPIPTFQQQVAESSGKHSHQLFCNPMNCLRNLMQANNDIVVTHLYLKDITIKKEICSAFLALIRGDNKSWESMAVDILRQKARWESITFEECQNSEKPVKIKRPSRIVLPQTHQQEQYMEVCVSFVLSIDNCAHLHLSNLYLEQPFTMQTLAFSKHLVKLQFDLMDLSQTISTLCHCLPQNQSLEILIASRCGLNDTQLAGLLGSLPDQLLEVRIFGNKCRTQGLAAAAILLQEHTHLQTLDLSYQHLPRKETTQNGGDKTGEINEDDMFDISWLMAALMSNTTLITLDLDNTAVDDNDLRHIIQALCENTTLENIMLNHNFITNDGVAALAARFHEMNGLKKISMYSNLFDAPTMAAPPTEITTPSISSSATQKQRNNNVQNPTISIRNNNSYRDDESNDEDDDDRTINTAVSSLADETVFQQMESNPTMLPGAVDDEVPQEPFQFAHSTEQHEYGDKVEGEQHYFDDGQEYEESVAPTEYEEVSVYTEVENDEKGHDASYNYGASVDDDSIPPYNPDTMAAQSIADAGGFLDNTTSF
eukprot:CAMPEP_0113617094 /NCGR_PEP_ID=MMETSP0017_2-20120614/8591_1 /TAXON_ID=2856 /ORGANISM="Cylindrotheca closterium" /LENGTH=653 /DNA_ID=CAMNT_0000526455 /DNA_START=186 /DNA_END=2147 /DNA_ORIENTATION=- /assembly_acc=CAM_ASM_000147